MYAGGAYAARERAGSCRGRSRGGAPEDEEGDEEVWLTQPTPNRRTHKRQHNPEQDAFKRPKNNPPEHPREDPKQNTVSAHMVNSAQCGKQRRKTRKTRYALNDENTGWLPSGTTSGVSSMVMLIVPCVSVSFTTLISLVDAPGGCPRVVRPSPNDE